MRNVIMMTGVNAPTSRHAFAIVIDVIAFSDKKATDLTKYRYFTI